jgi:hypothetical protein
MKDENERWNSTIAKPEPQLLREDTFSVQPFLMLITPSLSLSL